MHQTWGKLLFLHWPIPTDVLRPHIPARLEIDTFDGQAWISVTPFTMWNIRLPGLPALPIVSESHELNVRTYVHAGSVPGVWFFSLDASNALAVLGARLGFGLPYYQAAQTLEERGETIRFSSRRTHTGAPRALLEATWTRGAPLPEAEPDSLDFFLTERYCLYAERGGAVYRSRIFHAPWPLRKATLDAFDATMIEAAGLQGYEGEPLLHAQGPPLDVGIWPPKKV